MTHKFRYLVLWTLFVAAAQIAAAQVPTGTPPFGSYAGSPDIVNLGNLNAHWDVPIFAKPGRGSFNFTYDLVYDTSVWGQAYNNNGTLMWTPVANWGWAGQTQVTTGYVVYTTTTQPWCKHGGNYYGQQWNYSWVYVDAFGVQHSFPGTTYSQNGAPAYCNPSSSSMVSTTEDGAGWTISITSGNAVQYVQSRSATIIHPPVQVSVGAGSATDKNGNQITVNSSGQFFDTTSNTSPALTVSGTNPLTFAYAAPSGTAQFKVIYGVETVQTTFQCPNIQDYPATSTNLVTEIDLPEYNPSTNPNARYLFTYEATPNVSGAVTGRLRTVTLPAGGTVTYTYSGGNNGIMCADGSAAGMTRAIYDGTNTNTWTYTRSGTIPLTATKITDPQGNLTSIQFSGIYETQRVVNQLVSGSQTVLQTVTTCYNGATSGCAGASVGAPISQRNVTNQVGSGGPQSLTVFMYNGGLVTEEDDYDFPSGTTLLRKTITSYVQYSNGNIVPQTVTTCNPGGSPVSSYCNNTGRIAAQTSYGYDQTGTTPTSGTPQHVSVGTAIGNLTNITSYTGFTTYLSQTMTYFDTGNVQTVTDVNNGQTTYAYGACGNSYATSVSEPLGLSRSMAWNCTGGVATSVTDENLQNITTNYTDAYYWRPASLTDQANAVTSYCYGLLSGSTCSLNPNQVETVLSINSSSAVDRLTTYDGLGRVHLQQKRQAPGSTNFDTVQSDYDQLGRPSRITVPYTAGGGQTNPSVAATVTSYDPLSRPTQMTDPGNGFTAGSVSYSYPLNDVILTAGPAPSGEHTKSRQLEFDGLGRLTSVCEITGVTGSGTCGQASSQVGFWTRYTLDPLGNILSVTQNAQASSGQQTRSFSYDFLSRLTSESNPESGTTAYTYDADSTCGTHNGDRVKRVDAVGNTTCLAYDALHRVTSSTYSGPYAPNTPNKYFVYDSATVNGVSMTLAKARLAEAYTATSQTGSKITDEGFSYTGRGELSDIYEYTPHSGGYYHLNQTYWAHGMPSQLSDNIGLPTIQYGGAIGSTVGLDGEGRVIFVTASSGLNPVTGVAFNAASLPTQVSFGSGDTDIFAYDPTLRTNQFQSNIGGKTNTGTLTWNANSTLQQLAISDPFNNANNQTCNYAYDDLMRVTSTNCGSAASQTFSYNTDGSGAFGNLSKSGSPYSFQPTYSAYTNRMTSLGSITPTYDSNGNLTNDGTHTYAWDADGNSVTMDGVSLTFDALDRAVEKNNGGTYTEFAYSPTGAKLGLMSGTMLQKAFVMLPSQAQAVYTSSGLSYYRHSDWLGSYRLSSTSTASSGTAGTGSATVSGSEQSTTGSAATSGIGSVTISPGPLQSKQVQTQAPAPGTGSVTINGNLQSTQVTTPGKAGTGSVTFSAPGYIQTYTFDPCAPQHSCPQTVSNTGSITLTVNGQQFTINYTGNSSQDATLMASAINQGSSYVTASSLGSTTNLTAKTTGTGSNYPMSCCTYTWNIGSFNGTPFFSGPNDTALASGSSLTNGTDPSTTTVYDSGSCTITVNSHGDSTSWSGSGTTSSSIASGLYSSISGDSGAFVNASVLGSTVNLTAKTTGSTTNYTLLSSCSYDTSHFTGPSFSTSNSGPTLTNGKDAVYNTIYDYGTSTITVNGHPDSFSWSGSGTSSSSIASGLAAAINADSAAYVTAPTPTGSTVNLTAKTTGASTNYSLSSSSTYDSTDFSSPSFTTSTSGSTLTQGKDAGSTTYDSGSVWITINNIQYSASYGQGDSYSSVASNLASAISAGSLANASASSTSNPPSATVTIIAKTGGSATNYSLSSGSSTSQPGSFSQPSFAVSVSGSSLTGGANGTTTMYADAAYAPFGEPYAQAGATDLSFTGQNQDTVGGEYDFLAREYSTEGRWPSPDPAGLAAVDPTNPQSWNRYAYVANNPLEYFDPSGMWLVCDGAIGYWYVNFSVDTGNGPQPAGTEVLPLGNYPGCIPQSFQPWLTWVPPGGVGGGGQTILNLKPALTAEQLAAEQMKQCMDNFQKTRAGKTVQFGSLFSFVDNFWDAGEHWAEALIVKGVIVGTFFKGANSAAGGLSPVSAVGKPLVKGAGTIGIVSATAADGLARGACAMTVIPDIATSPAWGQ